MNFLLAILMAISPVMPLEVQKGIAEVATDNGMTEISGGKYYINNHQIQTDKIVDVDKDKYALDTEGKVVKGFQKDPETKEIYFFDDDGKQQTGFNTVDNKTYYFNTTDGKAITGQQVLDGETYYFNEDGEMQTGTIDGYLYGDDGKLVKNNWYDGAYYGEDGKLLTGIQNINGEVYNLSKEGKPTTGYNNNMYFGQDGIVCTGKFNTKDGKYLETDNYGKITYKTSIKGQQLVESALSQLGIDQWCTDLVNNSLKATGIEPRGTYEWYQQIGHWVDTPQPGDIAMYKHANGNWAHVALYIGNGQAVHGGFFIGNKKTTKIASVNIGSSQLVGYVRVYD